MGHRERHEHISLASQALVSQLTGALNSYRPDSDRLFTPRVHTVSCSMFSCQLFESVALV